MSTLTPTMYDSLKSSCLGLLPHHPAITSLKSVCAGLKEKIVPSIINALPEKITSLVRDNFHFVPPAILVTQFLASRSFISLNLIDSLAAFGLSKMDRHGQNKDFIEDLSSALFVLHSGKFVYNALKTLYSHDIESAWNAVNDFAIATKCGLTLLNGKSIKLKFTPE